MTRRNLFDYDFYLFVPFMFLAGFHAMIPREECTDKSYTGEIPFILEFQVLAS